MGDDTNRRAHPLCRVTYRDSFGEQSTVVAGDKPLRIGRAPENDIVLTHESVSRNHAEIAPTPDGWVISDLGSKNGIKINTYRTRRQMLRGGDRIDIGTETLFVDVGDLPVSSRARVVFQEEAKAARRSEVLDMDQLDSLFASSPDLSITPLPSSLLSRAVEELDPGDVSAEPQNLLAPFTQAAEALLTCDTLDQTLDRILELVFSHVTADRGVICLYDQATDTTEPKVMRTRHGVPNEPIVISMNIANDCIKRRQSVLVHDANMDSRFGSAESVVAMSIHSAMCAPLYRDGRVVGFIYVDQQTELHPFSATQLQTLSTLAVLSAVAVEHASLRDSVRREQEIRTRLARYSSPAVVEKIIDAAGSPERRMVAEEAEVSVLFADITNFTPLAESLHPKEVIGVLNQIFEQLTALVFDFDGTLDKFRGDGMMAFFGAPLSLPDHATRAVTCALRMQERLAELNAQVGSVRKIAMRIGINSGSVIVGDVGSPQRKDYTVIGDVVNTASRLESSVALPGQVVIGSATYEQVRDVVECQALEPVQVKGRRQIVRPYLARRIL